MNKAKKIPASPQSFSPHEVRISGGFWKKKMDVNRRETLPIVFHRCEETGRIDALRQTWKPGQPNQPHIFWDSDVAKLVEACSYSLAAHPDPALEAKVDEVVAWFASAQQPDSTYSDVVEQALYNGTISGVSVTRSSRTSSRSRTASSPSIGRSSSTWPASAPPRPPRRRSKRSEAIQ